MFFKLAWRNIWRNKRRSLITIISIVVAVVLSIFMRSVQLGMYDSMIKNVVGSFTGYIQIHKKGYWEERTLDNAIQLNNELESNILSTEGVIDIIPRTEGFSLASVAELNKVVSISAVNLSKEAILKDVNERIVEGRIFNSNENEILIGKGVAEYFLIKPGDEIVLFGQGYHGATAAGRYNVSGIVDLNNPNLNNSTIFMDMNTAQIFLSAQDINTTLILAIDENADELEINNLLQSKLDTSKYEVMTWQAMLPELEQTIKADSVGGMLMVSILYMIITFGIFGTVLMMTQERRFEFGILVSIGMKKVKLIITTFLEIMILSGLGIMSGCILVQPIICYFHYNPIVLGKNQAEAVKKFGFNPEVPALIDIDIPLTHGAIIFIITLIIGIYPIITILRLNPLKAMRR